MERLVETEGDRNKLSLFISKKTLPFRCTIVDGRVRSVDQNRLMWMWASESAVQRGILPVDVQAEWKLQIGVPILCAESQDFARVWSEVGAKLPHETQLKWMRIVSVTSAMNVSQMSRFLDDVEKYETDTYGVELTDTEILLNAGAKRKVDRTARGGGVAGRHAGHSNPNARKTSRGGASEW